MVVLCPNGHENPDSNRFCQSCGSQIATAAVSQLTPGAILGDRYRIVKELGQGGFGRTYLCEDVNRFNERCVLKEFAPQVQGTSLLTKAQQLFEREAGVMYRLQHPQIPMFREMFRVNRGGAGQLFLIQDFVCGKNYQELLHQKRLEGNCFTEEEIVEFLQQVLPVLGYIHSLGVIHRDISPDNLIKRDSDGLPVLIDFGGVKQVAVNAATQYMPASSGNSEVPTRLGKVGYAPNEQMQRGVVFPHSDLYALAATTLVLLTGKEPPDLIDPQNFTWNWREHVTLSPHLGGILDRMLQLRPQDRFESAEAILAALKSVQVTPPHPQPQTQPTTPAPTPQAEVHKSQAATVVATPKVNQSHPPVTTTEAHASLMKILGKTWAIVAAVAGAIVLGWLVASLTSKRNSTPVQSSAESETTAPTAVATATSRPSIVASSTPSEPSPAATSEATDETPLSSLELSVPSVLASKGVNNRAYGDAVKQVFSSQNPQIKTVKSGDTQIRSQLDRIASDLGDRVNNRLSNDAIQKIGRYSAADRANWRSQVNRLKLGERALIDLTNAKYKSITDLSAQKLGIGFYRFLNTPLGQIYQAAMFDRVQAIQSKQALAEIIFPIGGTSGTVSGTLEPGEGKAYIASLMRGQDIAVEIKTNEHTNLSIYPPTKNLPAMLAASPTNNWTGKTRMGGYHEFVLVSDSDRPVKYELKLTAADLQPNNYSGNKANETSNYKTPLF